MRPRLSALAGCALLAAVPAGALVGTTPTPSDTPVSLSAAVAGCPTFPANNYWHADIRKLKVHPRNSAWRSHMSVPSRSLRTDFGPYGDLKDAYGLPITVVDGSHPTVEVAFDDPDQSDLVPYPLGDDTRIEGGMYSEGDRHAIMVNKSTCRLYETYDTRLIEGQWHAGNGATWALGSNRLRARGLASADLAGFPMLPGLLRWSEVRTDSVNHALRFVTDETSRSYLWPARHGNPIGVADPDYPPMGARFRLKSTFSTDGFGAHTRVVIRALKRYGMVLVDRGLPWYVQGEQNPSWSIALVEEMRRIPASAFVAVDTRPLMIDPDSARARKIS